MDIKQEIQKRRIFGIISHPDAGKTTLTEKLLLFGGAIQVAGAVKSNKITKTATSDFMEIERQRGISVATSVMGFEYRDFFINLLDTPGHKDFAEDTYRTLTAVDSVILVIDNAKGVEEQTEKLMNVCRMRNTPVIVFVNKLDRDGQDPFELLDELEQKLDIRVRPLTWPIGSGRNFQGVYKLTEKSLRLFSPGKTRISEDIVQIDDISSPDLDKHTGRQAADKLREDVELIEGIYDPFTKEPYLEGKLAPVFFGSALNNFGVQEMLDTFVDIAPAPGPRETTEGTIMPTDEGFSGFVFKIHANLDPRHRDRIAFMRVCSGVFNRNKPFRHVRLNKNLKMNAPYSFMAQRKNIVEQAFPGDVIGLYDTGNFKIGDTLTEGSTYHFKGMPSFSPEIFREAVNEDPMKSKQLQKGLRQLTEEGVAQLFIQEPGTRMIIGTVGELQFEVIRHRLEHEYGAKCSFKARPFHKACWITGDKGKIDDFVRRKPNNIAHDRDQNTVYMSESEWMLEREIKDWPGLEFHFTSAFMLEAGGNN